MRWRRTWSDAPVETEQSPDGRRSDRGDTLIEILISLTVAGVALVGLLAAFSTAIAGSGEHRQLATLDSMLRTAAAEVTSTMQQQSTSTWASCSGASQVTSIPLPVTGWTASIAQVQFESANPSPAMLASDTYAFSTGYGPKAGSALPTSCPAPQYQYAPQQLTIQVAGGSTSGSITTTVDDPVSPNTGSSCPDSATKLVWAQEPGNGLAGSALFPAPTVVLEDSSGCVETNDLSQIQLSITPNTGTAGAALSNCVPSVVPGETTFQNCAINTLGQNYTLTASDPTDALTPIVSSPFSITAGIPVQLAFKTEPGNGTGGSALSTQPSVYIEDAAGNVVQGDSTTVTLAIGNNPGHGTLSGCTTTTTNGLATFSGCKIDKAGTGYTLTATDAADNLTTPSSPSTAFNVTVGPAAQLGFTSSPATTIAGDKFVAQPVVAVQDLGGNTVTTNTSTVSLAIGTNPGGGTLSGCTSTASAGVTSYANCSIGQTGTGYTLKATDGTLTPAITQPFNIVTAALTSFTVVPSTTSPAAGTPFNVTLTALDQSGATFPLSGIQTIVFSGPSTSPNGTAPTYPATVTFTGGVGTASVTLFDAQTTTITASQGAASGTSGSLTVSALSASVLSLSSPGTVSAGTGFSETVTAVDRYGNVASSYRGTVHFTSSDARAVLPANYTFTSTDNGIHVFSATLKTLGTQSITATDTVTGTITGTQSATVVVGPTSKFVVAGFTSPTTAGAAHNLTVTAEDAAGDVTPAYTGTVQFASSDAQAVLPANYTFTGTDAGSHTFSATLETAGTQSITATDTVTGSIMGSQGAITVNPASASVLSVSGFTTPTTAGAAHTLTVVAEDAYGNVATGYRGTVHFTSSDAQAVLPANYTFTATDNGTHVFSVTLKTAGTQSITATDTVTGTIAGTQGAITVNPSTASTLSVSGFTNPTAAGAAHNVTVSALDAYGNVASGYTGTVHFTSSDARAVLPANYTFTGTDAGTHVFSVTLKTPGTQSITATDTLTGTITGTQGAITVNVGPTSQFVVSGYTTPTTAGAAHNVTVTAEDAAGNVTPLYTGTVQLTSSDAQAVLPANYTFTAGDAGVHTFSVTLKTAGTQSITATDTGTGTITGTQGSITVTPATASTLSVSGFTNPTAAGAAHNVTVSALDAYGNVATAYRGTVHFTSSDAQAVLPANYTFTSTDNGTHVFSATLKTAGTQSITATDTVTGTIAGTQSSITVNVGATAQLIVSGFTTPTTAGAAHNVTVSAEDIYGNVTPAYTGTVHFTSTDAQAVLPANYTFTGTDAGSHTFSATLKTAGTQSITATDTVTGSIAGTQGAITVNAAALAGIGLTNVNAQLSPALNCSGSVGNLTCVSATEGADTGAFGAAARTLTANVQLEDAFGNAVTNTGGTVTINLVASGKYQSLSSSTVTIANGASASSSTFTFIRQSGSGNTATLTANAGGPTELTIRLTS